MDEPGCLPHATARQRSRRVQPDCARLQHPQGHSPSWRSRFDCSRGGVRSRLLSPKWSNLGTRPGFASYRHANKRKTPSPGKLIHPVARSLEAPANREFSHGLSVELRRPPSLPTEEHRLAHRLWRSIPLQNADLNLSGRGLRGRDRQCAHGQETADEIVPAEHSSRRRRRCRGVGRPTETGSDRPAGGLINQEFPLPSAFYLRSSRLKKIAGDLRMLPMSG